MTTAAPAIPPHVVGYRALKLWQRALDLAADAHRLAHAFPDADQLALAADLRRAAAGVPAAIAASSLAVDRVDQQRALQAAAAALARLETIAALAERLGVLSSADATAFLFTSGDVTRLLRGLTRSVAARMTIAQDRPGAGAGAAVARVAEPAPAIEVSPTEAPGAVAPPALPSVGSPVASAPPSMRAASARGGRRRAATRAAVAVVTGAAAGGESTSL